MKNLIGRGALNWRARERRSDRYGTVSLNKNENTEETVELKSYDGYGKLIAIVKETRKSGHIGDLFHGFFPETPNVEEEIELGEGDIFYETDEYGRIVGLKPKDGRETFWLNPKKLYRVHRQTVELYFEQ